jgi:hypothetical protein
MTQTMSSKFITSLEQQNHPHNIQLFVKLKCEWSCYSGTINISFKLDIMKGCLVVNFHKILESSYTLKRKGRLEGV